jgi:hypothetical protein
MIRNFHKFRRCAFAFAFAFALKHEIEDPIIVNRFRLDERWIQRSEGFVLSRLKENDLKDREEIASSCSMKHMFDRAIRACCPLPVAQPVP